MSYDKGVTEALAAQLLSILYTAERNDEHLAHSLQNTVHATGWYPDLAAALLTGLESALEAGAHMGQMIKDAYEKAAAEIGEFAKIHPIIMKVFIATVALCILAMLVPWAFQVLGFGKLGPIEGTFATWWQAKYAGHVPANSLFSFFQRLGMVWPLVKL